MALQSTRRIRIAVVGGAAAVVVAGGTGIAIAAASGPGSSRRRRPRVPEVRHLRSRPLRPSISPISPGR